MEKNNSQKILMIIIIVLVVGLIGFLLYDKFSLEKNCPKEKECPETKECPQPEECPKCNCDTTSSTSNSFAFYRDNLVKHMKDENQFKSKMGEIHYFDSHYLVLLNNQLELSIENISGGSEINTAREGKVIIKKNVMDFGIVEIGSGRMPYVFLINTDGTVERFDTDSYFKDGKVILNKFKKATNIISINQGAYASGGQESEAYFVDINGKVYENEYSGVFD